MKRIMAYWREKRRTILLCIALTLLYPMLHLLGGGGFRELTYGLLLSCVLLLFGLLTSYLRFAEASKQLAQALQQLPEDDQALPEAKRPLTEAWRQVAAAQLRARQAAAADMAAVEREKTDYYTLWLHQLKTPVAALDLMAQSSREVDRPLMRQELTKISQYAGAALDYQRLTSIRSDLELTDVEVYAVCCTQVKRLRPLFLYGQISLDMTPFDDIVLSDSKWLGVVVGQVLSNALKYTPPGGRILITMTNAHELMIRDTGIGIRPEDVPRVFDRGFTGHTGRGQEKSTGIGLYLCQRICTLLGHTITLESQIGEGTTVRIKMQNNRLQDV